MIGVSAGQGGLWAGTILGLQFVWYKDFPKTDFHSFDDGHEWQQMDKVGHVATAFYISRVSNGAFRWAGLDRKKSAIIGASVGFGYQTSLEVLDAFNADWGFSWWDMGANALGSLMFLGQELGWEDQKVKFKYSYYQSGLADYRPNLLGSSFASRTLKDYNAQTYWLSFNPITMFNKDSKFPKWINLSLGYGIHDQLIGDGGTYIHTSADGNEQVSFTPYRQFFLSFDIDLEDIPVRSKFLKILFKGLNMFKMPFPALEINTQGKARFRPFFT